MEKLYTPEEGGKIRKRGREGRVEGNEKKNEEKRSREKEI